jgi:GNAT superfamily N-acetyltransferase
MDSTTEVRIGPLAESELDAADRIFRLAFGTFLGVPDPAQFGGDADFVRTRFRAAPDAALAARLDDVLVGTNFVTNWGSVGFFGPLTVEPTHWDRRVAQRLLEATVALFDAWGTRDAGLFTFAQSARHVGLYQKFGFWPRSLTALMSRPAETTASGATLLSSTPAAELPGLLTSVRDLTEAIYPGLDVGRELTAVLEQRLGDVVLIGDNRTLQGVAVCHVGAGTEAGAGACYVKFAACRPGPDAERHFQLLLDGCLRLAADRGASTVAAGVNAERERAWKLLRSHGFRSDFQGVVMHRPNQPGYSTAESLVIDDWR